MSALAEDEDGNWNVIYYTDIADSLPHDDRTEAQIITIAS